MAHEMSNSQLPLTIIVAATLKNGIGNNGGLPWPMLKKEMAYFSRVTKRIPAPTNTDSIQSDASKQAMLEGPRRNLVIMGRKTWDSIPEKVRPLKDRTNIVISSRNSAELNNPPDHVLVTSDIVSGLQALDERLRDGQTLPVGRAFVIGGSSIYRAALELPQTKSILLTRINKDFECDTFFPVDLNDRGATKSGWVRQDLETLSDFVGEEVPEDPLEEGEGDQQTSYEFQLYQRP